MQLASPHRDAVRTEILRWLDRSPAFRALDDPRRRRLAAALARAGSLLAHDALWLNNDGEQRPAVSAAVEALRDAVAVHMELDGAGGISALAVSAELVNQIDHGDFVAVMIDQLFSWIPQASEDRLVQLAALLDSLGELPERPADPDLDRPRQREIAAKFVQFRDEPR